MVILYMYDGMGVVGLNFRKLQQAGALLRGLRGDWILMGDFSMPPEQLGASCWVSEVQGTVVRS